MTDGTIAQFAHRQLVIKIGGELIADAAQLGSLAADIATLASAEVQITLVHGGGPQIASRLEAKGLVQPKINGLRPTSKEAVGEVRDVLCNEVNSAVVKALDAAGASAVGLCGESDAILFANRLPKTKVDYGNVGNIAKVDVQQLAEKANQKIAVLAPIAISDSNENEVLNVNADEAARAVASAQQASLLIFVTDTDGVKSHDGQTFVLLDQDAIELLKADGVIKDGMIPKVNAAIAALESGVASCKIINGKHPHALVSALATVGDHQTTIVLASPEDMI